MKFSLIQLQKSMDGLVVMSIDLEAMFNNFLINRVPKNWEKESYPSLMPLASYVNDFIKRMNFIDDWLKNGPPISYWLPAFFFPQGFMTASMQV